MREREREREKKNVADTLKNGNRVTIALLLVVSIGTEVVRVDRTSSHSVTHHLLPSDRSVEVGRG